MRSTPERMSLVKFVIFVGAEDVNFDRSQWRRSSWLSWSIYTN